MVSIARSKNSIQTPEFNVGNSASFTNGGNVSKTIYTCPTGKSCIIKSFKTKMGALGANTYLLWRVNGVAFRKTDATNVNEVVPVEIAGNGIRITAGQTLSYLGDNATNNADGSWSYAGQELPA